MAKDIRGREVKKRLGREGEIPSLCKFSRRILSAAESSASFFAAASFAFFSVEYVVSAVCLSLANFPAQSFFALNLSVHFWLVDR